MRAVFERRILQATFFGLTMGSTASAQTAGTTDNPIILDPIILEAAALPQAETDYVAPTSINRIEAEPIDTPQTITAITAARIEEENIRSDLDLLNATPGVDADIREGFLTVRGYRADRSINGIPAGNFVGRNSADLTAFEQVEILKGPAAIFTGSGGFGGLVNYNFKRPLDASHLHTALGFGNPDSTRLMLDYNMNPMLNGRLRARVVGSYEDRDSNRHPEGFKRSSIFGTVEFDVIDSTVFRLSHWRQRNDEIRDFRQGLPTYTDGSLIDFPVDTTATQDWSLFPFRSDWIVADLEHQFNDRWKARLSYMFGESYHPAERSVPFECSGPLAIYDYTDVGIDPANPNGRQCHTLSYWNDWNQYEIFDVNVDGAFDAFGHTHEVVAGATQKHHWFRRQFGLADSSDEFIVDIFNPDTHAADKPGYSIYRPFGDKPEAAEEYQAFASFNLQATDKLSFPVAGRWSWVRSSDGDWTARAEFTPSLAAVYEINDELTVYGQYVEMFTPNTGAYGWNPDLADGQTNVVEDGILLPNVTGTQKEIGVKARVFGDALATASIFDIIEENRPREDTDPNHIGEGDTSFSIATGKTRSRGLDLSLSGEIRPGWNVGLGYAYINAKFTSDDYVQGADVGTARHSGNLWTSYKFQSGRLDGLSLGAGIKFSSPFKGYETDENDTNRVVAPGNGVVSARIGYDVNKNLSAALNIDNLFDKKYYAEISDPGSGNYYGETRRISLTLNSRF